MSGARDRLLARLKRRLEREGAPRLQVFLMMLLAGVFGAACSLALLLAGLEQMWLRYPIAAAMGYLVFVVALRLWAGRMAKELAAELDLADLETAPDPPAEPKPARPVQRAPQGSRWDFSFFDVGDIFSFDDELALVLLGLAVVVILALVVVSAPILLAEAVLDALLVAGLWRRFMHSAQTESVWGAVKATRVPAALVIACLSAIGYLLHLIDPTAKSIGDLFR